MRHGAMIDKYIGDAIMAVFGLPLPRATRLETEADAIQAVDCALAMERRLRELNRDWEQQNLPTASIRIGIQTGPVMAGSLGTAERLDYTVIGDTVNTASRLESLRDEALDRDDGGSPCRILIGEETLRLLGGRFQTRAIGARALRGKSEVVAIHRVVGRCAEPSMIVREGGSS